MNDHIDVMVIVEGKTEQIFIRELLVPYLATRKIYIYPAILGKKGGYVSFDRAQRDIGNFLRQRQDTYLTMMVDYYALGDWPGLDKSRLMTAHFQKSEAIIEETAKKVSALFPEQNTYLRFIPYISMHEIEALYFSDPVILAQTIGGKTSEIESVLREYHEQPEAINDKSETAPSKRLEKFSKKFKKTTTGIDMAQKIGVIRMRERCQLFDAWICKIENLNRYHTSEHA